jgi:hypothetical protein
MGCWYRCPASGRGSRSRPCCCTRSAQSAGHLMARRAMPPSSTIRRAGAQHHQHVPPTRTPYVAADVLYQLQGSTALAKVFTSPFGPVSPVTLSLRKQGGPVLASGSGPVGDYMELEASAAAPCATAPCSCSTATSLPLPSALGSSGLRVRVYQFWRGSTAPPSAAFEGHTPPFIPLRPALSRRTNRERDHSALRRTAANVSARIFRSRPSDQWAM